MHRSLRIFGEYCRNLREIGSVVPDSRTCVDALLRLVPFTRARVIVEFGAASGAVTREIVRRKRADTLFVSFEKNLRLYAALKDAVSGKNVFLVREDAFDCRKVLADRFGISDRGVDCIVSTLPCSSLDFDDLVRRSVLPALAGSGRFIQYMHTLSLLKGFSLKRRLDRYFARSYPDFVLCNLPPALVYTCTADAMRRGPCGVRR
jgi:phospholipid N-methyltransferase